MLIIERKRKMPLWSPAYKIRRSVNILSFAVRQNWEALQVMGEACFLFKRMTRANAHFQKDSRRVSTLTTVASASGFGVDSDTGYLRYKLWGRNTHPVDEYPDIGVFTCTVQASASTNVWEMAIDKYSFVSGRQEYAFDIYRDEVDGDGDPVEDAMYIVFNTPPMTLSNAAIMTYGIINPLVKFAGMQPIRDTEAQHMLTLFGYDQWLNSSARIRSRVRPNRFLLAFPGVLSDFTITDAGLLRETQSSWWTTPPPYSPEAVEHDMIVREATGQRFMLTNYTPIYVEDILCSQHFDMAELDPRSTLYNFTVRTT